MSGEKVPNNFLANVDISQLLNEKKNHDVIINFAINVVRAMLNIDEESKLYIDVPLDESGDILHDRDYYMGVYSE